MDLKNIYFFGTAEQNRTLEEKIILLPKGTIKDRSERDCKTDLKAQLLTKNTLEIYPLGSNHIEVSVPSANSTCTEDYVDFDYKDFNYRIRFKEKKD